MAVQWSLVLFTALVGLGCWCFVCVAVGQFMGKAQKALFPASLVALVSLAVGGLASVTHLSHPTRILEALSMPTSSIFMEGAGVFLLGVLILVYVVMIKRGAGEGALKGVAAIGAVVAVVLSFIVGNSYIMESRAAWNTIALPIAYVGTGAVSGVAVFSALAVFAQKDDASLWGMLTGVVGVVALVTVLAYALSAGILTRGDAALLLWGGAIVVGCVVPAACGFAVKSKPELAEKLLLVAAVAALIGALAFRVLMWNVGGATIDYFGVL